MKFLLASFLVAGQDVTAVKVRAEDFNPLGNPGAGRGGMGGGRGNGRPNLLPEELLGGRGHPGWQGAPPLNIYTGEYGRSDLYPLAGHTGGGMLVGPSSGGGMGPRIDPVGPTPDLDPTFRDERGDALRDMFPTHPMGGDLDGVRPPTIPGAAIPSVDMNPPSRPVGELIQHDENDPVYQRVVEESLRIGAPLHRPSADPEQFIPALPLESSAAPTTQATVETIGEGDLRTAVEDGAEIGDVLLRTAVEDGAEIQQQTIGEDVAELNSEEHDAEFQRQIRLAEERSLADQQQTSTSTENRGK